jgi:hypothetical protein
MKSSANNSSRRESLATFHHISLESCKKYGRTLWALVFNLLRQIGIPADKLPPHAYPVNAAQRTALEALLDAYRTVDLTAAQPESPTPERKLSEREEAIKAVVDEEDDDEGDDEDSPAPQLSPEDLAHSVLDPLIQEVVFSLFHHLHEGVMQKFFSCVMLYIVYKSIRLDGSLRSANCITQFCMHMIFCCRGGFMNAINSLLAAGVIKMFHE